MTDPEMTKLCAEAMGWTLYREGEKVDGAPLLQDALYDRNGKFVCRVAGYMPLHDDAQAMALLKRFRLDIYEADTWWEACPYRRRFASASDDLNRAIVECVAKMQAVK